jgi:hypothetical protein
VNVADMSQAHAVPIHTSAMGYQHGVAVALTTPGRGRLDQWLREAPMSAFEKALQLARVSGERHRLVGALEGVARGLALGDAQAAVRPAGATVAQRQASGALEFPSERRYLDRKLADARRAFSSITYSRAWQDGRFDIGAGGRSGRGAHTSSTRCSEVWLAQAARGQSGGTTCLRSNEHQIAAELVVSRGTVP